MPGAWAARYQREEDVDVVGQNLHRKRPRAVRTVLVTSNTCVLVAQSFVGELPTEEPFHAEAPRAGRGRCAAGVQQSGQGQYRIVTGISTKADQ